MDVVKQLGEGTIHTTYNQKLCFYSGCDENFDTFVSDHYFLCHDIYVSYTTTVSSPGQQSKGEKPTLETRDENEAQANSTILFNKNTKSNKITFIYSVINVFDPV